MEINETVGEKCRLCDQNVGKMYSLFGKNEQGQQIIHLIQDCIPIIVYRTDPLSKQICECCLEKLNVLYEFKQSSIEIANKYVDQFRSNGDIKDKNVALFMDCEKQENEPDIVNDTKPECVEIGTETEDLTVLCTNCRSEILDGHNVNSEIELCAELHRAIADTFGKNSFNGDSTESEKINNTHMSRRKRPQPLYNEPDDSMCSSLTEFTNTESSQQGFEFPSDVEMDSVDSEDDSICRSPKRRKIDSGSCDNTTPVLVKVESVLTEHENPFKQETDYKYFPLRLLNLCLNVINRQNLEDFEGDYDYKIVEHEPQCSICNKVMKNSKVLALHEVTHMNIELNEKVDHPVLWHESRDLADVRNKWLSEHEPLHEEEEEEDEVEVEIENHMEDEEMDVDIESNCADDSLLIPVGTEMPNEHKPSNCDIVLQNGKPFVNGIPLSDYPKEERRTFYHSMRIGKINKRFCQLCRYLFKDNWAMESHYFSLACHYTCRFCGMRFNKQRSRFEEHMSTHDPSREQPSTQIFTPSKNNNIVPKVINPKNGKNEIVISSPPELPRFDQPRIVPVKLRMLLPAGSSQPQPQPPPSPSGGSNVTLEQQQLLQRIKVETSQSKTNNQAYFCRKCYKVFFKLDEFTVHSKNCEPNQFQSKSPNTAKSPSGRPQRNCAKDAGPYRDELYLPESLLRETLTSGTPPKPNQPIQTQTNNSTSGLHPSFVCYICNTPFPTIYSRNSHMRIHKTADKGGPSSSSSRVGQRGIPGGPPRSGGVQNSVAHLAQVKQEPINLEPEVEIHEREDITNNLGPSISLTPIPKKANPKPNINANLIKLVQDNPNISIQKNATPNNSMSPIMGPEDDKTYKCSNCWSSFVNKSHLYFHKKNNCEGSKYPCPFCKKRFGTEAAYSSHIFYSHPE